MDEYLTCIDAWTASLRCEDARYQALPPDECRIVVDGCEMLSSAFLFRKC